MWTIGIIAVAVAIGTPITVIFLFVQNRDFARRLDRLEKNHAREKTAAAPAQPMPAPAKPPSPEPVQTQATAPTTPPIPTSTPVRAPTSPTKSKTAPSASSLQSRISDLTETLKAANWLILAGGVVLAFGIGFLIKYSIDEGLLGPLARVLIGTALGFGLIVFGEMARHRSFGRVAAVVREDALPPTLTAAGLLALFTSCYGAYALYGMLPSTIAFVLLAVIALAGIGLSLIHGPVIGSIGLAGAFAVPALVASDEPSALTLFTYLSVVTVASLGVARLRPWIWLAWIGLAGSAGWLALMSIALTGDDLRRPVTYTFAVLMAGAFALIARADKENTEVRLLPPSHPSFVGPAVFTVLCFLFFSSRSPDETSLTAISALVLLLIGVAYKIKPQFHLLPLAALVSLGCLLIWDFPSTGFYFEGTVADRDMGLAPTFPPNTSWFLFYCATNLILFSGLGLWRSIKGQALYGRWAGICVATALLTLATAFARIKGFDTSLSWGAIGLLAAAAFLFGTNLLRGKSDHPQNDPAIAAFAVGVLGATALAFTMMLERAWLSVALAVLIPGLGWVWQRVDVSMLRRVALVLSGVVLVRLVLNPFVLDYVIEPPIYLNWMLYGFGLPALAFYFARRLFEQSQEDLLRHVLEAGTIVFSIALIVSQFRLYIHGGDLTSWSYLLSEASFNTLIWLGFAYGLARSAQVETSRVAKMATRALFALAAGHLFWVHLFALNPLLTNKPVGDLVFFNTLALAYLAPIGFLGLFLMSSDGPQLRRRIGIQASWMLSVPAYVLGLIYLSMEVRHVFHGTRLNAGAETDAELYVYSLVWLLYAAVLMGIGIWKHNRPLRTAALATIALTTLKIFLMDMGELEGLLRVFSFFGLAISLLGIGYLYQRFVVAPAQIKTDDG